MQLRAYINLTRINNPAGIWLLFLPCLFGAFLSYRTNPQTDLAWIIGLFFLGATLMRSAGCIVNDIFDRKFDAQVKRTKLRPLATKEINVKGALLLLLVLLGCSLATLLQFNSVTIILGFIVFFLVLLYPLVKRFSYYPQILLGVVFNFGVLMATTAILGRINLSSILLYLSATFWTVTYDTIYAFQDIEDDLRIGVKSTAIKFRHNPQKILFFLTSIQTILLILVGFLEQFKTPYYLLIFLAFTFILCQIKNCNFDDQKDCLRRFKSNIYVGFIILLAIILG